MTTQDQELARVFRFSQAELCANQQGKIGDDQKRVLKSRLRSPLWVTFAVVGLVFLCVGALIATQRQFNPKEHFPSVILNSVALGSAGLLIGSIAFVCVRSRKLLTSDIRQAEGQAELLRKVTEIHSEYDSVAISWFVKIGSKEFLLNRAQFEALSDGGTYRVYYLEAWRTTMILSVETLTGGVRRAEISITERNRRLAHAFDFSETNLWSNREGTLTEDQKRNLEAYRRRRMQFILIGEALIFLFLGLLLYKASYLAILLGTGFAILLLGAGAYIHFRLRHELKGKVRQVQGQAHLFKSVYQGGSVSGAQSFARIGSKEFPLRNSEQHQAFVEGGEYRAYYVEPIDDHIIILSVEAV